MVDFICMGLLDLWGARTVNYKMKNSCQQWDSNPGPPTYERIALRVELLDLINIDYVLPELSMLITCTTWSYYNDLSCIFSIWYVYRFAVRLIKTSGVSKEGAVVAKWLSSWLVEQEVRGSIPGLANWISEIGYLLHPSRDMAEIPLKRRKSSIQPTDCKKLLKCITRQDIVLHLSRDTGNY